MKTITLIALTIILSGCATNEVSKKTDNTPSKETSLMEDTGYFVKESFSKDKSTYQSFFTGIITFLNLRV